MVAAHTMCLVVVVAVVVWLCADYYVTCVQCHAAGAHSICYVKVVQARTHILPMQYTQHLAAVASGAEVAECECLYQLPR